MYVLDGTIFTAPVFFLKMTRLDTHNPVITQPSPYNPTWRVRNIHRFYSWQGCQEIIWNQNIIKFHEIKKMLVIK